MNESIPPSMSDRPVEFSAMEDVRLSSPHTFFVTAFVGAARGYPSEMGALMGGVGLAAAKIHNCRDCGSLFYLSILSSHKQVSLCWTGYNGKRWHGQLTSRNFISLHIPSLNWPSLQGWSKESSGQCHNPERGCRFPPP